MRAIGGAATVAMMALGWLGLEWAATFATSASESESTGPRVAPDPVTATLRQAAELPRVMARPSTTPPLRYAGRVIDSSDGEPLVGASVGLCAALEGDDCDGTLASAVADEHGRFVVEPPPPDDGDDRAALAIVVALDGFASVIVTGARLVDAASPRGILVRLDALAALSGRVVDGEGQPVSGVTLGIRRRDGGGYRSTSDDEGSFTFVGVVAGPLTLFAYGGGGTIEQNLRLGPGEQREVELTLEARPRMRIAGQLLDGGSQPLALVQVVLDEGSGTALDRAMAEGGSVTGLDGKFEIDVASRGPHRLRFFGDSGARSQLLAEADLLGTDRDERQVVVTRAGPVVHCALVDAAGRPQRLEQFAARVAGGDSFGLSGESDGVSFLWPAGASSVLVGLRADHGSAQVRLGQPSDVCVGVAGGLAFEE